MKNANALKPTGPKWQGVLRHVLSFAGAMLISLGILSEEMFSELNAIIMSLAGLIVTAIAFVKSWLAPEKKTDEYKPPFIPELKPKKK